MSERERSFEDDTADRISLCDRLALAVLNVTSEDLRAVVTLVECLGDNRNVRGAIRFEDDEPVGDSRMLREALGHLTTRLLR